MTISSTNRKAGPYPGNGVAATFPFAFKVFAPSDVVVVLTNPSGGETTLTLGPDYSIALNADQDNAAGGTVVLPAALASGYLLTITSDVQAQQPVDLTNQGGFYPRVINSALDRLTILVQQLAEKVGRAVKVGISSDVSPDRLVADLYANSLAAIASATTASSQAIAASQSAAEAAERAASIDPPGIYSALAGKADKSTTLAGYGIRLPTQAEAEAGLDDERPMTPLLVAQAIAALGKQQFPAGVLMPYAGIDQPSWGLPLLGGAASRTIYKKLFTVLCPVVTAMSTAGSAVVNVPATLHWYAGMPVEDARFAAGTTVTSIDSATTATLSNTASAGGSGSLRIFLFGYGAGGNSTTFGLPLGAGDVLRAYDSGRGREQWTLTGNLTASSNIVTGIASTRGILIGSTVTHASITGGSATVTKITTNSITLSAAATAAVAGAALVVNGLAIGAEGADALQNITGAFQDGASTGSNAYYGVTGAFAVYTVDSGSGRTAGSSTPLYNLTFDASRVARTGPETTVKRLTVGMYICHGESV